MIISDEATAQATANATRVITIPAPRGEILDVKGRVLVENRVTTVVAINPNDIDDILPNRLDRLEMFTKLAIAINRSADLVKADAIEAAYQNSSYSPYDDVPIAYDVSEDLLVYVNEHSAEFPGVTVREATVRSYPYGELGAHLLGWVGSINRAEWQARQDHPKRYELRDEIGKAGIEQMFEEDLRGYPGTRVVEVDKDGNILRERTDLFIAPIPGNDVRLTIDIDIQSVAERELAQAIRIARSQRPEGNGPAFDAPGGSVVMLDPENGDVIAMASYPTYDPNDAIGGFSPAQYSQLTDPDNDFPLLNRVVQGEYPPGSTFKPITAIAALREGVFGRYIPFLPDQPQSDPGTYTLRSCLFTREDQEDEQELAGCVFNNANKRRHAGVDLPRSLTVSSDWYYYQLGEAIWAQPDVNHNAIQDVAAEFGFGQRTGIQMPSTGERRGRVPSQQQREELAEASPGAVLTTDWFTGDNVNLAIGQGDMLATPLQMAVMYSVLANGGTRFAPNLVAEVDRTDRERERRYGRFRTEGPRPSRSAVGVPRPDNGRAPGRHDRRPELDRGGGTAYAAFHDQTPGA